MCGGCNIWAEGAGVSLIMARYWWVARQGARAVAAAEAIATESAPVPDEFVDPLTEVRRVVPADRSASYTTDRRAATADAARPLTPVGTR